MARRPSQRQIFNALAEQMEPRIRAAFLASIRDIRSEAQLSAIIGHIEAGRIDLALTALNLRPEFFAPLDDALRGAYLAGGAAAVTALPRIADPFPVRASRCASTDETRGPNDTSRNDQAD
jgi:hypothetical protein